MNTFTKQISIRWSDLDPNFHMRHSAFYDFGAQHRVEVLEKEGLSLNIMQKNSVGPILFREECIFRKEIRLGNTITINAKMAKLKPDASRWTIVHEFRNELDELCATITVDGAWMDTKLRKIANPTPEVVLNIMNAFPKTDDFILL